MDVNDLVQALNGILELGDTLDSNAIGIQSITNGQHTTRDIIQMELGQFLLYVGDGGNTFTDGQAALVNLLLSEQFGQAPAWRMKEIASAVGTPDADENMAFQVFHAADIGLSEQKGQQENRLTEMLIGLYESFGKLMVLLNQNILSQIRCDNFINALKARLDSESKATTIAQKKEADVTPSKPTLDDKETEPNISKYIPDGVTLTDNQKECMNAIVTLSNSTSAVSARDIASFMNKPFNSVSTTVRSLVKKGLIEADDDGEIKILKKKEQAISAGKGGLYRFNQDIQFDLPDGYAHDTVMAEGGSTEHLRFGKIIDEEGKTSYEFDANISLIDCKPNPETDEVRKPGEKPLDVIKRRAGTDLRYIEFGKSNVVMSWKRPVRLLGLLLKYKLVSIGMELDKDTLLALQVVYAQDDDKPGQDKETVRHLMKLFNCMTVKGKKCTTSSLDERKFIQIAHCEFDEENDESSINLNVGVKLKVNGEESDIGTINLSKKPQKSDMPDVPYLPEIYHEHYTIVTSGSYTSHRDADYRAQDLRGLMRSHGNSNEKAFSMMTVVDGLTYRLDETATKLAKVFRMDEDLFDPYNDTEALIHECIFKDVRMLHALRSLAWIVEKITEKDGSNPESITYEKLEEIGEYIESNNYLVYEPDSKCSGLCGHYDWHVFFVPRDYINSKTAQNTDLRVLTGKENRGGNSSFVVMGGDISAMRRMNAINSIISRNEETLAPIEDLRDALGQLKPVMETIHDGLLVGRDRSEKLEGPLADALTAWCTLAIAAITPFYSEEAADSYEANAALEHPLTRPDDELDDKPIHPAKPAKQSSRKSTARKTMSKEEGNILDLGGKTTIEANQFSGNMGLTKVIIPEGVTEIGERAFYSCMNLESVIIPGTVKKIDQFAFMSCRNLKKVELGDGIEEIETHVFGATNNLAEVHLPDSLKKVDRLVFGIGGDSPYATAYLSGKLAQQLYDVSGDHFQDIYARHIIIDGKPYESIKDYLKINPVRSSYSGASQSVSARNDAEARKVIEQANEVLSDMQDKMTVTKAALERHAEIRSKQEAEKEKNKAAARARGKSDKDEADMLAVLLIEEDQGNLYRDDDDFVKVFSEDFGAYNENQLKRLRNKIRPKIHDAGFLEEAKEEMLSRPVKDRFSISTANWFNLSPSWNFDGKGETAIQKTRLWYRENELAEVRQLMETHKRDTRRNVGNQLNAYNSGWDHFNTVKNDLQIEIWQSNDPVPPQHSLYDVQIAPNLQVKIVLKSPSMGMLVIPVMNVFTSVWNVTPEQIWDAALRNELADARGVSRQSMTDAKAAKAKALEQIRKTEAVSHSTRETSVQRSEDKESIRREIQRLENEKASLKGLFAFAKRAKIQKQIDELYEQLK